MVTTIKPEELKKLLFENNNKLHLIDVRTPGEYRAVHLIKTVNIPIGDLNPDQILKEYQPNEQSPLYFICKSGMRGERACEHFIKKGFLHVVNIQGGTEACIREQLPAEYGEGGMSLERQVRIVTGLLILMGVVLGYFLDPLFILLSGVVGAGLVFAGVTNTCAMGMLIAKMPWNRAKVCF